MAGNNKAGGSYNDGVRVNTQYPGVDEPSPHNSFIDWFSANVADVSGAEVSAEDVRNWLAPISAANVAALEGQLAKLHARNEIDNAGRLSSDSGLFGAGLGVLPQGSVGSVLEGYITDSSTHGGAGTAVSANVSLLLQHPLMTRNKRYGVTFNEYHHTGAGYLYLHSFINTRGLVFAAWIKSDVLITNAYINGVFKASHQCITTEYVHVCKQYPVGVVGYDFIFFTGGSEFSMFLPYVGQGSFVIEPGQHNFPIL